MAITPEDREAADRSYTQTLQLAKAEHDALLPEASRINSRIANLKVVIRGASNLLGQSIEEQYTFRTAALNHQGRKG